MVSLSAPYAGRKSSIISFVISMFFPLSCLFDLIEIIKSQTLHKNLARNTGVALYENVEAAGDVCSQQASDFHHC